MRATCSERGKSGEELGTGHTCGCQREVLAYKLEVIIPDMIIPIYRPEQGSWDVPTTFFSYFPQDVLHACMVQFSSVQSLSRVRLFATPWTAACQASLSITNSRSLPKPMSIKSVMPSSHLILCCPLLLLPPIPPSIRVFSNESTLRMRWPKYWSFSFSISLPMNTQDWSPLGCAGWTSLQSKGLSRGFSNTTVQKHQFFGTQLSSQSNSHIHTWPQEKP